MTIRWIIGDDDELKRLYDGWQWYDVGATNDEMDEWVVSWWIEMIVWLMIVSKLW